MTLAKFGDCVTLLVHHVLPVTFRVEDNASRSVYRRYKDISNWFQNVSTHMLV